jgi:hypothetical protein
VLLRKAQSQSRTLTVAVVDDLINLGLKRTYYTRDKARFLSAVEQLCSESSQQFVNASQHLEFRIADAP